MRFLALAIAVAVSWPGAAELEPQQQVTLTVNLRAETADIRNTGDTPIDITRWVLVSVRGDQRFTFPRMTLPAGAIVTVTAGSNARHDPPRYLRWTTRNVWNNDGDPGRLFDAEGRLVTSTQEPLRSE